MKLNKMLLMAGLTAALTLGANSVTAQPGPGGPGGGRNFDPAQMRQRFVDRSMETLNVTDEAEKKVFEEKIGKIIDARMDVGFGGRGFGGQRRGGNTNTTDQAGQQRPRMGGNPSAAGETLQKALDAKAPAAEIKTKLEAYRAEVKAQEAKLEAAQEDLKKLLTQEQEAAAVLGGLLK